MRHNCKLFLASVCRLVLTENGTLVFFLCGGDKKVFIYIFHCNDS